MNLRSVDLNLLTVFDAVMREGNLTRAAAKLGMSQPATSDAVSRLRHLLRDDLFIRTGHGVRPTARALEYAAPIRRILDMVIMTLSEAQNFDFKSSTRRFNLVLREYGELVLLSPLMQWLDSHESGILINISHAPHDQVAEELRSGVVDMYLTLDPPNQPGYTNQLMVNEKLLTVVRQDHPLIQNSLTLEQFLALEHVLLDWEDIPMSHVEQELVKRGLERRKCKLQVHSLFDMPRVVASTNMACSLPSRMAQSFIENHKLKAFPIPLENVELSVYLSWHHRFENDAGHQWIRNKLMNIVANT